MRALGPAVVLCVLAVTVYDGCAQSVSLNSTNIEKLDKNEQIIEASNYKANPTGYFKRQTNRTVMKLFYKLIISCKFTHSIQFLNFYSINLQGTSTRSNLARATLAFP